MKGPATGSGAAPPWSQRGALVTVPEALARLRRLAGRRGTALRRRLTAAHVVLRARWLRSLQLRVVTTTLLISAVMVTVLGFFLMQQITSDQLQAKELQAGNTVQNGLISARTEPAVDSRPNGTAQDLMDTIVGNLQPAANAESSYGIAIMVAPSYSGPPVYRAGETAGVATTQIPKGLLTKVGELQKKGDATPSFTFASMSPPSGASGLEPGLVYGVPVGPYYQLYYFFPLTQVQQTLAQIQRTLLVGGVALVFLFVAIVALVTRWVVAPVRYAARAAQRLSTGNLGERMPVRGVDELAALATSFNQMAASLHDKMTALEDLSQAQRQFVSDVSHELRTPLTTIKLAADVIFASRDQLDGPVARSAEVLQSQLERFESLLTDLLEISRYDANVADLDPEPVDVCDLARQAADVAQQLAERRGAKIEFRLPAEPCVAEVDRVRVERILRNLLVNAVEHGEGKDAVVTVAGDSAAVAVAVRDYGIGLAAGEERLVFDRFWRADPARARTTGGTGLGLAIALEDARIHGGWLEAWGEPGRGSVFRLTLPRIAGAHLVGSPLPLAPDEAELAEELAAEGLVAGGLSETNGAGAAGLAVVSAADPVAAGAAGLAVVSAADPVAADAAGLAAVSASGPVSASSAVGVIGVIAAGQADSAPVIGVIAAGQADSAPGAVDRDPSAETVATQAGATEPASRG
jgi:two-component system, OmpR family, sensor histidine kinase MtrB